MRTAHPWYPGAYKWIYTPKIAKLDLNNWRRICCLFSKCQYVVVNVQQCSLLHEYAISLQRHFPIMYEILCKNVRRLFSEQNIVCTLTVTFWNKNKRLELVGLAKQRSERYYIISIWRKIDKLSVDNVILGEKTECRRRVMSSVATASSCYGRPA